MLTMGLCSSLPASQQQWCYSVNTLVSKPEKLQHHLSYKGKAAITLQHQLLMPYSVSQASVVYS